MTTAASSAIASQTTSSARTGGNTNASIATGSRIRRLRDIKMIGDRSAGEASVCTVAAVFQEIQISAGDEWPPHSLCLLRRPPGERLNAATSGRLRDPEWGHSH